MIQLTDGQKINIQWCPLQVMIFFQKLGSEIRLLIDHLCFVQQTEKVIYIM